MPPPTSTHDQQGTVIDGTARSAEWRKKQRAAQKPQDPDSAETRAAIPAADFDPAPAKDFVSGLMIPADKLAGEARDKRPAPEAPEPYISKLLGGSREPQGTEGLDQDLGLNSTQSDELDRWFEEQATAVPQAPAGQALLCGSASLDIDTTPGTRAKRGWALPPRRGRASENWRPHRQGGRRLRRVRVHLTRLQVLAGTTLAVLAAAMIAIADGGAPAPNPRTRRPLPLNPTAESVI